MSAEAERARQVQARLLGDRAADSGLSERYRDILNAAAALFAERGYRATSIRDIGDRVGLQGGSLYHHIKSKEALFITIHDLALDNAADRIRERVAPHGDPWARLEAACIALLEIQLDPASITMPLMNNFQAVPAEVRSQLVARRDAFEAIFTDLVAALPLSPAIDPRLYRVLLLTLLNNVSTWYREGRYSPAEIGRQIMGIFRHEAR
ncbi:MAG: TetR family transcriptional regulator [Niveispirillum sp.]|nr:TetR family transcriptional regulator [Niveispirillum sp.]